MRQERTYEEALVDRALLLTLWHDAAPEPLEDAGDKLRQMKLAWIANHGLFGKRAKGLDLAFYRWTWGPMSNHVYEDWTALEQAGLVENEERFVITNAGAGLVSDFRGDVVNNELNALFKEELRGVTDRWREEPSTKAILDHVYAMTVQPVRHPWQNPLAVRDMALGTQLTLVHEEAEALARFHVEQAWMETLALLFAPGERALVAKAERAFREGRVTAVA